MSISWSSFSNPHGEETPAMRRGKDIHNLMADIMRGYGSLEDLYDEVNGYWDIIDTLQQYQFYYNRNGGGVEEALATNIYWQPTHFDSYGAVYRGVIDLWIDNYEEQGNVLLIDYKTGRFYPSMGQLRLYSALFLENYKADSVMLQLAYLDAGRTWPPAPEKLYRKDMPRIKDLWAYRNG